MSELLWGSLREWVLGISPAEASFARRGFRAATGEVQEHLERAGRAFVGGYTLALRGPRFTSLLPKLEAVAVEFRGFAFEGASMALALLDWLTPWRRSRLGAFLAGPGEAHTYLVHVGAGWILGRVPASIERLMERLDPLLRWLTLDGYGFHEGFFRWARYQNGQLPSKRVTGYGRRVFDQGLGRSLWFVHGADVYGIAETIARFPRERRNDLWSGVGLACAYAGVIEGAALKALRELAGDDRIALAQGAAFAAKARQRGGNLNAYTELACQMICGMRAEEAARLTDAALENLPINHPDPAYEVWRRRIQDQFSRTKALKNESYPSC